MKRIAPANIVYLQSLNGNTLADLGQEPDIPLGMTNRNLMITHGTVKIQVLKLIPLGRRSLISGVFMTCMEMSGNGVRIIGLSTMKVLLQMEVLGKLEVALTVFSGAVAGTSTPGAVGLRTALGSFPATASVSWVSVF